MVAQVYNASTLGSRIPGHTGLHIPESNVGGKEFKKKSKKEKRKTENKSCNKCEAFLAFRILLGPGEMAH